MRKLFLLIFCLIFFNAQSFAEDWDDFSDIDRMWDGQQTVTNQEFEQVMDALEEKGQKKKDKAWYKKLKRIGGGGTSLHSELNPEKDFSEIKITNLKEDGILINLPVNIVLGSQVLDRGFYKVIGERDENSNKMYLNFYQSQFFKGKIEVIETQDDYGEETLDFARILPFNESFVKIIYGSIDFNAYTYLPYSN